MKHIALFILTTFFLVACGSDKVQSVEDLIASGNLEEIRAKKSELDIQQQELATQLLDKAQESKMN